MRDTITDPGDSRTPQNRPPRPEDEFPSSGVAVVGERFVQIPERLLYDPAISSNAKVVWGIIRRHGDCPDNAFPSYRLISSRMPGSERSVQAWTAELEEAGWLLRVPRYVALDENGARTRETAFGTAPDDGRTWVRSSNGYVLYTEGPPRASERVPLRAPERGGSAPESAQNESQGNESHAEQEELSLDVVDARPPDPDPFDEFWSIYPRRVGKRAASAAFGRARLRAPVEEILDGARRFARDPNLPESQYVPHPTTWLNADRWEDDPLPPRRGTSAPSRREPIDTNRDAPEGRIDL